MRLGLKHKTKFKFARLYRFDNKILVALFLLICSTLSYDTTCPIGCYDCKIDTPQEFEKLRKSMPPSFKKVLRRQSHGQNEILNPPVTCEGCWGEHLGTVGCPPKWVKRSNCLAYHKTGICVICKENFIVRTFANDSYLDSKCIPYEPRVVGVRKDQS